MKKLTSLLLALVLIFSLAACAKKADTTDTSSGDADTAVATGVTIQEIADRGVLRVGVKVDVPLYGFLDPDTNEQTGLEADIARTLAQKIIGDDYKVEFQAVTAATRGPLLDNGEVDLVIATFTITEERKLSYNFSQAYFLDAIGFLVKKELGATQIADLDGLTVGVAQGATTKDAIAEKAEELGITINFSEYGTYPELKTALTSGRIDAFSVDKSILLGYVDDNTEIIAETFKPQEYGIASKLTNTELAAYVDQFISDSLADGTLAALISEWGLDR